MADSADLPPPPVVRPPRRWVPSAIWLVPLAAAAIGAWLVIEASFERGPTIVVTFLAATGLEAGKTKVKVKDVEIGSVRAVRLAEDASHVEVEIDLVREARAFTAADSRFWVVRPRLAVSGVTGLETLMSGAYIGAESGSSTATADRFTGLEAPPVVAAQVPGRRFILDADDAGSLDVGSPVFFRRIPVGQVERLSLDDAGRGVRIGIFIEAPYDRFVTAATRFWHASGVGVSLDARGIRVDTQSLAAILLGGVAFEDPDTPDVEPAFRPEGSRFPLAVNRAAAFEPLHDGALTVKLRFSESVRGLAVGAPLDLRGVEVGRVSAVTLTFDPATHDFTPVVFVEVYPERLKNAGVGTVGRDEIAGYPVSFDALVKRGMRAQLRPGNLLTGQLFVAVDFFPDAPPAVFDPTQDPPELPTVPGDLQELYAQVQGVLRAVGKIPFETLGEDAHQVMVRLDQTLARLDHTLGRADQAVLPEVRDTLREIRSTLGALQVSTAPDAPLHQDVRQALRSLGDAARALQALAKSVDDQPEALIRGRKEEP